MRWCRLYETYAEGEQIMRDAYANIDCLMGNTLPREENFYIEQKIIIHYNSSIMVLWVYFLGLLRTSEKLEGKPGKAVMHND